MDTVTLDGKVYLKATRAAALVGYAPDYIGQLCRKGAIDAKVLGKTWYVREESLLAHKASKVRMNTATTRRDIQKQQNEQKNTLDADSHVSVHTTMPRSAEYRNRLVETKIQYSSDTDDLLPSVLPPIAIYPKVPLMPVGPMQQDEDSLEENSQEIPVPIRVIASLARKGSSLVRTMPQVEREPKTIARPSRRSVVIFSSLLPVMCLFLLLFVLANIVLESTWSYTDNGSKQTYLETTYNLASVSSIMEIIRENKF